VSGARSASGSRPAVTAVLSTSGVTKRYGSHTALDAVDLHVPRGSVYGLVGPNGSGKTTLFSIIVGLRRATSGRVDVAADRGRVALVPDTPQFDPWLTAWECVDLARHLTAPHLPSERVDAALERVGLAEAADRRNGGFSRGMLQRLGLATAVVSDPELLILDEPCSALDPAGRREVLDLVAGFRGSATVLFSSHILGDVQEVCDTVGILRRGELLFEGGLADLLRGRARPGVAVRVRGDAEALAATLKRHRFVDWVEVGGAGLLRVGVTDSEAAEVALPRALADEGAAVVSLLPLQPDLESVFLELTR
jgi:ABC-2 type transport system ATP-binding protein